MKYRIYRNPDGTEWRCIPEQHDVTPQLDVDDVPMKLMYEYDTAARSHQYTDDQWIGRCVDEAYRAGYIDGELAGQDLLRKAVDLLNSIEYPPYGGNHGENDAFYAAVNKLREELPDDE